jgi:hypothetical protein
MGPATAADMAAAWRVSANSLDENLGLEFPILVREQTWDRERMPYEGVRSIWSVRIRIRVRTRWFYADSFLFLWVFYIFLSLLSKLNDKITNFQKYTTSTVKSNSSEYLQIEASKYYLQVQLQKIEAQF